MPKASTSRSTAIEKPSKKGKKQEQKRKLEEDYDQVFQQAVNQEEQGERYQFGAKARRNFESSIKSYRLAVQLLQNSSDPSPLEGFNSHFNLARVLIHFGSCFASARSECVQFVKSGIEEYRQAIVFAIANSNQSDQIDGRYNLGLGISSLADMLSAGATEGDQIPTDNDDSMTMAVELWKQAKEELSQAYTLQNEILVNSPVLDSEVVEGGPGDEIDQSVEESISNHPSAENGQTTLVEEVFVITPSVVIDTLVDICEVLLSIYPSEPDSSATELGHYIQELQRINQLIEKSDSPHFSRRSEIENLICNADLTAIDHKLSSAASALDPPALILEIEQQLMSVGQRLQGMSKEINFLNHEFFNLLELTDNLSSLCSTTCLLIITKANVSKTPIPSNHIDELEALISNTLSSYSIIIERLNRSKLQPIKQINPHEVPQYICSSLIGQSELHLILEFISHQRGLGGCLPAVEANGCHEARSFGLAIEAYNQTSGPYRIAKHPTHPFRLEFTPTHPAAAECRADWPSFSGRLASVKALIRSKFHHAMTLKSDAPLLEHGPLFQTTLEEVLRNELVPLVHKFDITPSDLARFFDDFSADCLFLLSNSVESHAAKFLLSVLS